MYESPPLTPLFLVYAFLWGAAWGSFLNVVIWRLPRGMSLSRPASHCPECQTPIRWYDNVPIFGWLWLRGRCRACSTSISSRYPLVEALVALLSTALMAHVAAGRLDPDTVWNVLGLFLLHFYFVLALVGIAFIDLDLTIIPHKLTIPTIVWGLVAAAIAPTLRSPSTGVWLDYFPAVDWVSSMIGLLAGAAIVLLVFKGYMLLRGIAGIGGGDVWMMAAIGANLGWLAIPFVLMFASLQGTLAAVVALIIQRTRGRDPAAAGSLLIRGAHEEAYWESHPVLGTDGGLSEAVEPSAPDDGSGTPPETAAASAETVDVRAETADPPARTPAADDGFMRMAVPFGPFLALGAIEYLFIGRFVVSWTTGGVFP